MSIENGQVNYNASGVTNGNSKYYYVDTMASFSCNFGYSLSGSDSSICQISGGGTWNPHIPICIQGDEITTLFCLLVSHWNHLNGCLWLLAHKCSRDLLQSFMLQLVTSA